jgi:hypothetical protein
MAEKSEHYRGGEITWPEIRRHSAGWSVNVASDNPNLLGGRGRPFEDGTLEGAIRKARQFIDEQLAQRA